MRVGGPNGIELGDSTLRVGGLAVQSPAAAAARSTLRTAEDARTFAPLTGFAGAGALTNIAAAALAVFALAFGGVLIAVAAPHVLFVAPALVAATSMALFAARKWWVPQIEERAAERKLLQLAAIRHGEFSLPDAALVLNASLEQADARLTALARKGHVELKVDESKGVVRYRFRDVGSLYGR